MNQKETKTQLVNLTTQLLELQPERLETVEGELELEAFIRDALTLYLGVVKPNPMSRIYNLMVTLRHLLGTP